MKKIFALSLVIFIMIFAGCYEPSPLYGTWEDSDGNSLSFVSDGSFVVKIKTEDGSIEVHDGTYSVLDNVVTFSYTDNDVNYTIPCEWDIRGSILYVEWSSGGVPRNLKLYHTGK